MSSATTTTSPSATGQAPSPAARPRRLLDWRIRFGVLALVWGFSFLFIKVGTEAFAPLYVTLGRMVFGTAVLLTVLVAKRERLPRGGRGGWPPSPPPRSRPPPPPTPRRPSPPPWPASATPPRPCGAWSSRWPSSPT